MSRLLGNLSSAAVATIGGLIVWGISPFGATTAAPVPFSAVAEWQGIQRPERPAIQADPLVVRSRYITIDFAALPGPTPVGPLNREPSLPLDLFDDVSISAVFDRYDPNPTGMTWIGHVDRVPRSTVSLVYGGGLMAGTVVMPSAVYSIRPAPREIQAADPIPGRVLHVISEINQNAFPPEAPPIEVEVSAADIAAALDEPMSDTEDFVDLMVLYTPTAEFAAIGPQGIVNLINLGISDTNTSFVNSQIRTRLRLVHAERIEHTESSSFGANLSALRAGSGSFSGVPALRDAHRADLVKLLIHPASPSACGIAYVMTNVTTAFAPNGYSVTDTSCVANFTFAHEVGHNMGAQHDWFVSTAKLPYTYAHGYADPTPGQRWRTIMSYNDLCTSQGFSCSRTLHWSNPALTFVPWCTTFDCSKLQFWFFPGGRLGVPGGSDSSCVTGQPTSTRCDADNSRALNNTALTVANFRDSGS